ncbi:hypothetical protein ABMA46_10035 [Mesorhizobium sp. CN5-321]|uniref:hypothetical protein n=1 Tax=Mesorhizobium hunchu TaxID=3157708 RepID=UPI0032B81787
MGKVKIRYYSVLKNGRGYWQPTAAMRRVGFKPTPCGPDGPSAWAIAEDLNAAWDARAEQPATVTPIPSVETWPAGSVGEAYLLYRGTLEWSKKAPRTREDWDRAWRYIKTTFGDYRATDVTMPMISEWRQAIEEDISLREAHRALKIWRALWRVMIALKYATGEDPSLAVRNTEPKGRSATWSEGEAVRLIKRAIRAKYFGLAAALACMWDGAAAPVDARTLTLGQKREDEKGIWFDITRRKTGRDGVLTLSKRSERLFRWYVQSQFGDAEPMPNMAIFRTRRGAAYLKNSFSEDFRDIRKLEFPEDTRVMLDFRRSGSVEAVAGGVKDMALSAKLANSVSQSKKLEQTYVPVQVEMVRLADEARKIGRNRLRK